MDVVLLTDAARTNACVSLMQNESNVNRTSDRGKHVVARLGSLLRRLGPAGPMAALALVLPPLGAAVLLGQLSHLAPALRHHAMGPILCVLAFGLLGGLGLLPSYVLSIFTGWCFGLGGGFVTAMVGFAAAVLLAHAFASRASGRKVVELIESKPEFRAVYDALLGGGSARTVFIVALLRLLPFPPFPLTSVMLASAGVRRGPFVVGSLLGMAPSCLAVASIAAGLERLDFSPARQPWMLAAAVASVLLVFTVIAHLARQALRRVAVAPIQGA
jgi:uncharacterized membrane protein YdjX (TVP38/TMEM64 family)